MQTTFTKSITAQFEQVGRRQKLVGQLGQITDESGMVIHSQLYNTHPEAEAKLNALVRELLIDYAERGLVDTLPVADVNWNSAQPDLITTSLAQSLANVISAPVYVVAQNGAYLIQDDANLDCYGGRAQVVATYRPLAVTRQSQAIEARLSVCGYCQGIHHIQQCPTIHNAVRAKVWKSADLGRGLCQMLWRDHAGFVQLLSDASPARRVEYAESYLMFLASRSSTNLTVREVLATWAREMGGDRGPAAMSVAA
jgi:hypothetical protein